MLKHTQRKNTGLLILRIGLGGMFLLHGVLKLTHMTQTTTFFTGLGFSPFWGWVVAIVETLAGLMILLGIFTWISGMLLAAIMVVAFVKVKLPAGGMQAFTAGKVDIILFMMALGLAFTGPGRYSLMGICKCGKCMLCKANEMGAHTCDTACNCNCDARKDTDTSAQA